ncbi:hypothetical protein N7E02_21895 [Aliirhizobium terrae]|uniref:hypothetical protein n=1 Tax=Terrirhizobium terrae TaxID=2926709 RepID=UPI002578313F|nr:hypothetical protein [Rhizobium sp. CC-CFT758]WJH39450.1 hypothetical protein N7E02_21895 [Rhizobium sp. CC-CFT758]
MLTQRPPTGMTPQSLNDFDRIVLVWRKTDGSPPPSFDEEFSDYLRQQGITVEPQAIAIVGYPYQWGRPGDQYRFGYAVIDLKK